MKFELQNISSIDWQPAMEQVRINGGLSQVFKTKLNGYEILMQTFHINKELRSVSFTFVSPFEGFRDIKTSDLITANRLLQQIDELSEIQETNA